VASLSAEDQAERLLGKGLVVTGSHPNSGRLWRLAKGSKLVYYVDGSDPANWPIDQSYAIGVAYIARGEADSPTERWRSAPIMKAQPGSFWTTAILHLSKVNLLKKFHALGYNSLEEADGSVDIFGEYKEHEYFGDYRGDKFYVQVSYSKNGYVTWVDLGLRIFDGLNITKWMMYP